MRRRFTLALLIALGSPACGDGVAPGAGVTVNLELVGLRLLDPEREGTYEAWTAGAEGSWQSTGRFTLGAVVSVPVVSPVAEPRRILITVEPPDDDDDAPATSELLVGDFVDGVASLTIVRAVTGVDDLESDPGHHALFTPSNRFEAGFPSLEDAGIWLFAPEPSLTKHNSHFLKLTPLRGGWIYEGWIVHDYGTANACWISYGKFLPDGFRDVNTRDDTGLGPFSGQQDYVEALPIEVDMPGDDWVSNIHGMPVPCGLELPFDLNGKTASEPPLFQDVPSPWTHVITIEPRWNQGEPLLDERPFLIQPYRNPFGQGGPNQGRVIEYHEEFVPSGTATVVR